MSAPAFLGRGWRFPLAPRDRELGWEEGAEKVRQAIWLVLDTEPGERLMRPTFGCGLRRYLMKPNSGPTRALIAQDVARALAQWEPRIEVRGFFTDGDGPMIEDPVTGSLNASVAQWLLESGRVEAPYVAAQGRMVGRDGRVAITTDEAGAVWVGGAAVVAVRGEIATA